MTPTKRALLAAAVAAVLPVAVVPAAAAETFPEVIDLPVGYQPEGIEAGAGTTVYVGSLADGAVWRGDLRTGEGEVWAAGEAGRVTVGLSYDDARGLLWAAGGSTGEVRAYDVASGEIVETYTFAGVGFLNDLTVTHDGVYVTDSNVQQLVVIPFERDGSLPAEGTLLPITGDLEYVTGFNANGIVDARGYLLVVQSATGLLFRVDPSTGESVLVDLGGASLTNGDGMELRGSTLWVVRNRLNLVAEIRLGPGLLSGRLVAELSDPDFVVPTTATFAAGALYAVNAKFGTPPAGTPYEIVRV